MNFHKLRSVICKIILWNHYVDFNILPVNVRSFVNKDYIIDIPLKNLICSNLNFFVILGQVHRGRSNV